MDRLYKPARDVIMYRGLFSYLTESAINMINYVSTKNTFDVKYYHDLFNIPGYGEGNLFDICLIQDKDDYETHKHLYKNIEEIKNNLNFYCYTVNQSSEENRLTGEKVIKRFFKPKTDLSSLIKKRQKQINFNKTIGVHRRSTDIIHHHDIVPLEDIFKNIESEEFENIFLMCDTRNDLDIFKERYGNKVITYDEFTSNNINLPFFKDNNTQENINNHVKELLFGVFTMSKTKKFICTKSNISSFCLLANSKLNYKLIK
jgi:hypothetical protein